MKRLTHGPVGQVIHRKGHSRNNSDQGHPDKSKPNLLLFLAPIGELYEQLCHRKEREKKEREKSEEDSTK